MDSGVTYTAHDGVADLLGRPPMGWCRLGRTRGIYETDTVDDRYYCRFGLRESYRPELAAAGLVVAGTDSADGGARILR